jgi:hypothetical protein
MNKTGRHFSILTFQRFQSVLFNQSILNIPKTNVENGVSRNTGTVNIPNGIRHSNSKDEIKVKHEIL